MSNIKQNSRQLASLQIGGAICLPLLLIGYELAQQNSPLTVACAILIGNCLLFFMALTVGSLSCRRPLATADQAICYFGYYGKIFFGLCLAISMVTWFALQSQSLAQEIYFWLRHHGVLDDLANSLAIPFLSVTIAALIAAMAFLGLKFLVVMADFCVPLLIGTIMYTLYDLFDSQPELINSLLETSSFTLWDSKAVSLVIASSIAATVDLPTYYRHAKDFKASAWASAVTYLIATPLIQLAGIALFHGTHAESIGSALRGSSAPYWHYWVMLFLFLAGWTTNNMNLYSATISIQALSNCTRKISMLAATAIALLLSALPLLSNLTFSLAMLGVFIATIGTVIIAAYFLELMQFQCNYFANWSATAVGCLTGLACLYMPHLLTCEPVFAAVSSAIIVMLILHLLTNFVTERKDALT